VYIWRIRNIDIVFLFSRKIENCGFCGLEIVFLIYEKKKKSLNFIIIIIFNIDL
jgi:hypothetical protein